MSPIIVIRKNVKLWIRGLIATAINGFASGVVLIVADPVAFNLDAGLRKLVATSTVFAIFGLANYLKQHPLPDDEDIVSITSNGRTIGAYLLPLLLVSCLAASVSGCAGTMKPPVITPDDQAQVMDLGVKALAGLEVAGIVMRDGRQLVSDLHRAGTPGITIEVRTAVNSAVIAANEIIQRVITHIDNGVKKVGQLATISDMKGWAREGINAFLDVARELEKQADGRVTTAGRFIRSALEVLGALVGVDVRPPAPAIAAGIEVTR